MEIIFNEKSLRELKSEFNNREYFDCKNYDDNSIVYEIYSTDSDNKVEIDYWHTFVEKFLIKLFTENIAVLNLGENCREEVLGKYSNNPNLVAYVDKMAYDSLYIYLKRHDSQIYKDLIFFDFYWTLNEFRFYIYSKDKVFDESIFEEISNKQINDTNFLMEIQLTGDGKTLLCINHKSNEAKNDKYIKNTFEYICSTIPL